MNVVKIVFLESHNLLCQFHIDKNVKAKCKQQVTSKETSDQVMEAQGTVMDCPTNFTYEDRLTNFVAYVKDT